MILSGKGLFTCFAVSIAIFSVLSCATGPQRVVEPQPVVEPAVEPEPIVIPVEPLPEPTPAEPTIFDPTAISEEVKSATFVDVRALIDSLNEIIRKQDYEAWRSKLTEAYTRFYSDPAILAKYSEYPIMKRKGIKLETLKDYFVYVVYPSRQNDKVDDIEFVGENLIKAITVSPKGDRNILYMLEKHGDAWMIGIGR